MLIPWKYTRSRENRFQPARRRVARRSAFKVSNFRCFPRVASLRNFAHACVYFACPTIAISNWVRDYSQYTTELVALFVFVSFLFRYYINTIMEARNGTKYQSKVSTDMIVHTINKLSCNESGVIFVVVRLQWSSRKEIYRLSKKRSIDDLCGDAGANSSHLRRSQGLGVLRCDARFSGRFLKSVFALEEF